jgi:BirA family transcriptional regulator, biotin operon repressor / biotin---[acetyl-CoA-carboxylase] ligase
MRWASLVPDLAPDPELTAAFAGCLPGGRLAGPLLAFAAVDSTQTIGRRLAAEGAPEGTVIVADAQRAGRGQRGRTWTAPPGAGLLLSCLLRPPLPPSRWPTLTLVGAAAVVDAVRDLTGIPARLKWPNDVLVEERKLAGVLAESVVSPAPFIVMGLGVNVGQRAEAWPPELQGRAVSLAELGHPVPRADLLAALLARIETRYEAYLAGAPADRLAGTPGRR